MVKRTNKLAQENAAVNTAVNVAGKLVRSAPIVGNLANLGVAGYRAYKGDYAGAGLAAASALPGPAGWAAFGADVGKDVYDTVKGGSPQEKSNIERGLGAFGAATAGKDAVKYAAKRLAKTPTERSNLQGAAQEVIARSADTAATRLASNNKPRINTTPQGTSLPKTASYKPSAMMANAGRTPNNNNNSSENYPGRGRGLPTNAMATYKKPQEKPISVRPSTLSPIAAQGNRGVRSVSESFMKNLRKKSKLAQENNNKAMGRRNKEVNMEPSLDSINQTR